MYSLLNKLVAVTISLYLVSDVVADSVYHFDYCLLPWIMTKDMLLANAIGVPQNSLSIILNLILAMYKSDGVLIRVDGMNLNIGFEKFDQDSIEDKLLKVAGVKVKMFDHGLTTGNLL